MELRKALEAVDGVSYVGKHGLHARIIFTNGADKETIDTIWPYISEYNPEFVSTQMHAVGVEFELNSAESLEVDVEPPGSGGDGS